MGMGQPASTVPSVPAAGPPPAGEVARAHAEVLADRTLQFDLAMPPPPEPPPAWLKWLGDLLERIAKLGPVFEILFWVAVAAVGLLILFLIARSLFGFEFGWKRKPAPEGDTAWRPDQAKARVLLEDADALAAQGRYGEAAHMLLLRGVADIIERRPRLIGPSLTSRDIAALTELPDQARPAFGLIAELVERSLFGGRDLGQQDWSQARLAYERLIFAGVWK